MWCRAQCRGWAMHCWCQYIFQAVVCGISLVCRAGVCMCWHSPLVLLDEPASANYLLNKISISATHLYANCILNFLRWKRSKNLQGEIIFCCSVMNTDCRDAEKFIRVSSPLFFDRRHKHQDNSALQKIPRLCLVKTILNWFCMTEPTINNNKKKRSNIRKRRKMAVTLGGSFLAYDKLENGHTEHADIHF